MSITLNVPSFQDKLAKLTDALDPNTIYLFTLGTVTQETNSQPLTSQFHLWLLAFEFSETAIAISKTNCIFLTSKRKQELINAMKIDIVKVIRREGDE
jgi:nucleosome binding factor SPN SPT16 subunit